MAAEKSRLFFLCIDILVFRDSVFKLSLNSADMKATTVADDVMLFTVFNVSLLFLSRQIATMHRRQSVLLKVSDFSNST